MRNTIIRSVSFLFFMLIALSSLVDAQIIAVEESRAVWASASAEDDSAYEGDGDSILALGFGHFEEGIGFSASVQQADGTGSSWQISDISSTTISANASGAANAYVSDYWAIGQGIGETRFDFTFDLIGQVDFTLVGDLSAWDNGTTHVNLWHDGALVFTFFAAYNQTTAIDTAGTLAPGRYRFDMNAAGYSYASGFWNDYGFAEFDVQFGAAIITGLPIEPAMNGEILSVSPNPMHSETVIYHQIPTGAEAEIEVYDITGRRVRELLHNGSGNGSIVWDSRDNNGRAVSPGIYFVRLASDELLEMKKVVLIR